jgi:hypothetical protein
MPSGRIAKMTTGKRALWAAAGVFACVLTWAGSIAAQPTNLPLSVTKANQDMRTIKNQLEMAQQLGRTAMQKLKATPIDDSIPMDNDTIRAFRDTYVMIRAAKESLELRKERQKYPDPILDLAYKRTFEAWHLALTPTDKLSWSLPRAKFLQISIRDMGQALRLIDQVLVILP